ncbi:MAG TPA: hypothetical protein VJV78_13965 [Polyangiales bacterium]|nr:hypothetical protein [Polyangiales bacterium]
MIYKWDYWGTFPAVALIAWVPLSFWLFSRYRPTLAAAMVLVGGTMWLPEAAGFDFPLLPPLNKYSISALCALLGAFWKARARVRAARFGRGWDLFVFVMMLGEVGTVLTNGDALRYGSWKVVDLPPFLPYDGVSAAIRDFLDVGIPFFLGRIFLRTGRDLRDVFTVLVVAGLIYTLPELWELRMSPMLHVNIYGYAARADWLQNIRMGGYRPTVFMGHGLIVGFFMFICTTAAIALQKAGKRSMLGVPLMAVVAYLFLLLVLCKAAAALIYGALAFWMIRYMRIKSQLRILMFFALVVVSYPVLRLTNVFPTKTLLAGARMLGPDREESLQFRFDNEDILVLKAEERPWFGWGGFGRERVYDNETGKDIVVQDGHWIPLFGTHGVVGFAAYFLLMLLPVLQAWRKMKNIPIKSDRVLLTALGLIIAVCCVNELPNMNLPNLQFFLAAGLAVLLEELPKIAAQQRKTAEAENEPAPGDMQAAARSGVRFS